MSQCQGVVGQVIELAGSEAVIELPERTAGCGRCNQPGGCQSGLLGVQVGTRRFRVRNTAEVRMGEQVSIEIADGSVWRAARAAYLAPVLLSLFGAAGGQTLFGGDGAAVAGMLVGLAFGMVALRRGEWNARRGRSRISLQVLSLRGKADFFEETS